MASPATTGPPLAAGYTPSGAGVPARTLKTIRPPSARKSSKRFSKAHSFFKSGHTRSNHPSKRAAAHNPNSNRPTLTPSR
jgi:hypothetical protein